MNDSNLTNAESDFGRIQLAPEILLAIVDSTIVASKAVVAYADGKSADLRRHSKRLQKEGILLTMDENRVIFDIYVIMDANVNIMEAGRELQTAVVDHIAQMSGVQVNAVNIHVEDVSYSVA